MTTTIQPNLQNHHSQLQSSTSFARTSSITSPLTPHANTPRTPSIRFAPLPDPRASRATAPGGFGGSDVWWSREEKPDGTWGDYRLVVRRPNGQIIAIDDLALGSNERTQALETYRQQQTRLSTQQQQPLPLINQSNPNNLHHHHHNRPDSHDSSIHSSNRSHSAEQSTTSDQITSAQSDTRYARFLPPLVTQPSHSSSITPAVCLTPAGSTGLPIPLTLTRTTSRESTYSNHSNGSNYRPGSTSSLTRKFIEAMKKPLARQSYRLTPTNSLPIDCSDPGDSHRGAPLCKSRSDESGSSVLKGFSFGRLRKHPSAQMLRRTRSKDETTFIHPSQIPLDEPPTRRRSNYPPVAQRKAHMGGGRGGAGKLILTEEPDFVEWKAAAAPSPGTTDPPRQATSSADDDGSGMAWLRKRKREREERLQREEQERLRDLKNSSPLLSPSTIHESQPVAVVADPVDSVTIFPIEEEDKPDDDRASTSSSISQSSILSQDGAQRSGGTRTSTSSATDSSKHLGADDEDLNEEELKEEERLKLLVLAQSPFVRGATEVYRDREHHQVTKKTSEITQPIN